MALFDVRILREVTTPEAFRRGRQYAEEGAVQNVRIFRTPDGGVEARGTVYGSYSYDTSVVIAGDGSAVENYECDCPYSQAGACKHVIALGIVAARRSVAGKEPKARRDSLEGGVLTALRSHVRGRAATDEALARTARRLDRLDVRTGTVPRPASAVRTHGLGTIAMSFSYDASRDLIRAEVEAQYGPIRFPAESYAPLDDGGEGEAARRDWQAEKAAAAALYHQGFRRTEVAGTFERSAEHAFTFLRQGIAALGEVYEIRTDAAFDALARVREESAESAWEFKDGGEDWFAFSVDWKAAGRSLTAEEIRRLALGLDRYVRGADGSFVEIRNADALRRVREATRDLDEAGGKGRGRVVLSRALELALLAEETAGARIEETTQSLSVFLRDAKAGKLLVEPEVPEPFRSVLRPYQRDAVAWALFLRRYGFGGVLADDMGLGKTLQTLAILSTERPAAAPPSLVVCPKTLVSVWLAEAAKFAPELRVAAVDGAASERERVLARAKEFDLLVTSYSSFQRDAKRYRSIPLFYAVLDEAQYVKNSKTATASAVKTLRAKHRLALTGTPVENGVHELWSLFDFLMPGLLGDHASFRAEFERPIRDRADADALARLKRRIRAFLIRRTKEAVAPELPPRMEQVNWCALAKAQAALYADVLASVRADVYEAVERKGFNRAQIDILTALLRLRQVCNHPALVDKRIARTEDESPKAAHALELVREAAEGGHKVLLFSQFTSMLDILREGLDRMGIGHATIEGKTKDRAAVVRRFRDDASVSVFLLSLRAGGTGLTLTEADTVLLFDPWWNPMVERQAMDRAHRIGQTKRVNVYKLATKGTVEEKVLALQEKKKALFEALVSESGEGVKGLTWEEVQGLFD